MLQKYNYFFYQQNFFKKNIHRKIKECLKHHPSPLQKKEAPLYLCQLFAALHSPCKKGRVRSPSPTLPTCALHEVRGKGEGEERVLKAHEINNL